MAVDLLSGPSPAVRASDTELPTSPAGRGLAESRVDLFDLIADGIPPREFVTGSSGIVARGKRHHLAAEGKTGKSLSIGVRLAISVALAGGTVTVLDRENGADEYARRVQAVIATLGLTDEQVETLRERYLYHAFPDVRSEWGDDPADYVSAFGGADLVIFDSSRTLLTNLGLNEDSSDDYARFSMKLIDPLAKRGIATIVLDNTGLSDRSRGRGTSAKADLADVAFSMRTTSPFSPTMRGELRLTVEKSRIAELSGAVFVLALGGGSFGSFGRVDHHDRPDLPDAQPSDRLMERIVRAVAATPGMSKTEIRTAVTGGRNAAKDRALEHLIEQGHVLVETDPDDRRGTQRHRPGRPYPDSLAAHPAPPRPKPAPTGAGTVADTRPDGGSVYYVHGPDGRGSEQPKHTRDPAPEAGGLAPPSFVGTVAETRRAS